MARQGPKENLGEGKREAGASGLQAAREEGLLAPEPSILLSSQAQGREGAAISRR